MNAFPVSTDLQQRLFLYALHLLMHGQHGGGHRVSSNPSAGRHLAALKAGSGSTLSAGSDNDIGTHAVFSCQRKLSSDFQLQSLHIDGDYL